MSWSTRSFRVTPGAESSEESFELRRDPPRQLESELKVELSGDAGGINDDRPMELTDVELLDLPDRLHSRRVDPASKEAWDAAA